MLKQGDPMKHCPFCQCEYPSTENFCQIDGVALAETASRWEPFTPEAFASCLDDELDRLQCLCLFDQIRRVIPCAAVAFSLLFSAREWRLRN